MWSIMSENGISKDLSFIKKVVYDNISNTVIEHSSIHGFGLFASTNIPDKKNLCQLDGQVIDATEYSDIENSFSAVINGLNYFFFMECNYLANNQLLVRPLRTKYSYINHSSEANVELQRETMTIVTIREIKAGEELLIDYRKEPLSKEYLARPEKAFLK